MTASPSDSAIDVLTRQWAAHRGRLIAGGLVVTLALIVLVAHTPPVRALVLSRVVSSLEAAGITVRVARLDYNLLTLRAAVHDIALTAAGADAPFLTADALRVDLPWSIVGETRRIQSLEIDRPAIAIVSREDGSSNLPSPAEAEAAIEDQADAEPLGPIRIDRLVVSELQARYQNRSVPLSVNGRGVTLAMDRAAGGQLSGRLSMSDGITLQLDDRETTMATLESGVAFDGTTLSVDALTVEAPEGRLQADGAVSLLAADPRVDLTYRGRLDAARLAPWAGVEPAPEGSVELSGAVRGPIASPEVTIELASDRLAWSTLGAMSVNARLALSDQTISLDAFRAALAGGRIHGEARLQLDGDGASRVQAEFADLNLGTLASVAPDLPVRIASTAGGDVSLEWSGQDIATARGRIATRLTPVTGRRDALGLAGRLDLELSAGRWALSLDQRIAETVALRGQADGRLVEDDWRASTMDGRVTMEIGSLPAALGRLRAAGLPIDAATIDRVRGTAAAQADLGGTFGAPRAAGTLAARELVVDDIGPGTLQATFAASPRAVTLDPLTLDLGPNSVRGQVAIGLEANTLSGALTARLPDLEPLVVMAPAEWRFTGSADVDARLAGTLDNPTAEVMLSARDLAVAGQTLRTVASDLSLANRVVTVHQLELTQDEGRLSATGRYDLARERYAFEATGRDLVITPLVLSRLTEATGGEADAAAIPLDARFDLQLSGEGTVAAPRAQGFVQFAQLDWDRYRLGAARADLALENGTARVKAGVPSVNATVQASIGLDAPQPFTFDAAVADAELSSLVRASGPAGTPGPDEKAAIDPADLAGALTVRARGTGQLDDLASAAIDLNLQLVDVAVNGAPLRLARPARLRYADQAIVAEDLELLIGTSTLSASGTLGTPASQSNPLLVQLTGELADFLPFARLAPAAEGVSAAGAIDLRLHARGSLEAPDVSAQLSLTNASLGTADVPPVSDIRLRATYAKGLLVLDSLHGRWQGAALEASGRVPATLFAGALPDPYVKSLPPLDGEARLQVRLASVTAQVLTPFLEPSTVEQIAGRFDLAIDARTATLDVNDITADVTFDRAELELARVPLGQTRPTQLRLAGGRLEVVEWSWAGAGNQLDVAGTVDLAAEPMHLALGVTGALDLRMLGAFVPDVVTAGRATLEAKAAGPADEPAIEGEITIADGDIIVRDPRLAITDLTGAIALSRDRVQLRDVTASANGGMLQLGGEIRYPDFELAGGTITITGRGLAFEIPDDLRTEVNADLTLALSPQAPTLTGRVTVLRGSYREPVSLAGQLLTGVEEVPAAAADAEPGFADRIQLGISVVSDQNLIVDNNYGRLEVGSNLKVIGTVSNPVLAGRLTIEEGGEIFLGGRTYDVRRGTVDFTNATRIEPDIDLALETRVQSYNIILEVSGTPEMLETNLRSDPATSQEDVVSLLLTGQLAESSTVAQSEIARGQLVMLLSGELLGFAGRAVGLDSVQVSRGLGGAASDFDLLATDNDPSARLTVTKDLSRNVEIVFSQSLKESGDITWIAIYQPIRNIELRGTTEDDNSRAYEFRHQLNFGGGATRRAGGDGPRREREARVAAVAFTGTPGFSVDELRERTRLEAGDRFDFYRWQQDQDRLADFYHDRDFLEARISARRRTGEPASGEPTVTLEYQIARGPPTRLRVDGFTLSSGLVEEMKEAWGRAVFDGFLLEDLEAMARRALVEDSYLRAEVTAAVASPAETGAKEIVVTIVPGPRFADRRIAFSRNERLTADELDQIVDARDLEDTAWLDASAFETALEQHYRSIGHLAAEITVDPPVFTGTTATLPVRVNEGRPFQIAEVDVQGVAAKPEAAVREAFGVAGDQTYLPSAIEPARRNVEVAYLRDGYNDVRVAATTLVDRDRARVHISLTVAEGPQQIVSDVAVSGAEVTRRGTIDRALDLETGQPANLTDAYRAQKRLYDTGAFQSANVDFEPIPGAADGEGQIQPVRAVVTLQEVPRYRFRYGLRLNDEVGPTEAGRQVRPALVADLLRRNLFGRAVSTGLAGQIEADRRLARGFISLPQLFGLPVTSNLYLTGSREDFTPEGLTPFGEDRREITAEQRFRPARTMAVSYAYSFARAHIFDLEPPSPTEPALLDVTVKVARLQGTYAWDTRDDPADARRGWFHSSGLEYGIEALGSDLRFVRYLAQQYFFRSFGEPASPIVLASGFRLGAARGFGQDLIASERFFAGGGTSVRGFAEDGLGELDFLGDPRGGNALLLLNQEVRFPIYGWARGVAFVDAGNLFRPAGELSFTNLEAGTGFGLRIHSPFALIRVDYGIALTDRARQPFGRWYFGIGQTF